MYKSYIFFYFFYQLQYEKSPLKVGYFSKTDEIFSTALTAQSAQKGTRFI
jgi:hypothetical protein